LFYLSQSLWLSDTNVTLWTNDVYTESNKDHHTDQRQAADLSEQGTNAYQNINDQSIIQSWIEQGGVSTTGENLSRLPQQ